MPFILPIIALVIIATFIWNREDKKEIQDQENKPTETKINQQIEHNSNLENSQPSKEVVEFSLEEQSEFFSLVIYPEIENQIDEFHLIWDSLCVKSFDGVSNGDISLADAYGNFKVAEKRYERLYDTLSTLPDNKLSKDNKAKFGAFRVDIEDSIALRLEVIKQSKKMIDKQNFKPSTINELQELIDDSNQLFYEGLLNLKDILSNLGVEMED